VSAIKTERMENMSKTMILIIVVVGIAVLIFLFKGRLFIDGNSLWMKTFNKDNSSPIDKFTYDFQYADYNQNQTDEKGETDFKNALDEFNKFPWKEQLIQANKIAKVSPTIDFKDHYIHINLAISVVALNYSDEPIFYVCYVTSKDVKILKDVSNQQAKQFIELFFNRNHEDLRKYFK
jgi:hypothetical protein